MRVQQEVDIIQRVQQEMDIPIRVKQEVDILLRIKTGNGYSKVTDIIVECIATRFSASVSVSGPQGGPQGEKPQAFFWRGFVSPIGSARPKERFFSVKHKRFGGAALRPTPYSGRRGRGGLMPPPPPPSRGRKRF